MRKSLFVASVLAVLAAPVGGADYDPLIPTPQSILGYELGDWVTDYHGMETYLAALAASSERVTFESYGEDYEHRQLRFAVASSPANHRRLDEIRAAVGRLTRPRELDDSSRASLIDATPLVVWLNYSTDGNETAGLESALMMAYHLAADQDRATSALLEEAVVILTPVMNPSSHERWASWSNSFAARGGNPDPQALEHNPPWGVLTNNNHYLVDLNRESLWATQRESRALRELYYRWNPQIFVDHHGEYDNFAGPGYQEPLNPYFTESQRAWLDRLGEAIGKRFGEHAWSYWPWETGTFYPGFWESIGLINGAIGFTYETTGGGGKGLRYRREDGSLITLRAAAEQHFQASLAVIETAVPARGQILAEFADYFRTALDLGKSEPEAAFLIEPGGDLDLVHALVEVLQANQVEVFRLTRDTEVHQVHDYFGHDWPSRTLAAGSLVIPVAQPRARLLLTLMRQDLQLPQVTLAAAETFRRNQEIAGYSNPKIDKTTFLFYDVTAWSLPLTYGVAALWTEQPLDAALEPLGAPGHEPVRVPDRPALYGYMFSGRSVGSMALLAELLQQEVIVNTNYSEITIAGQTFPRGSFLARVDRNLDLDLLALLREAGPRHGIDVVAIDSPHSKAGPSLGSDQLVYLRRPRIAALAGDPVSTRSFGDLWFILEQEYGLEFTAIDRAQLDRISLDHYDVLVLPDGWYEPATFDAGQVEALVSWIERGGTLVCIKGAASWATRPEDGISRARLRPAEWPLATAEPIDSRATLSIPGAILRVDSDPHHFLTFGIEGPTAVLVRSNLAFEPDRDLAAPLTIARQEPIRLAGFAYEDSIARLAGTPYAVVDPVGNGKIVLFLDDPNFRVYWYGLHRLFLNSLLLAPSF